MSIRLKLLAIAVLVITPVILLGSFLILREVEDNLIIQIQNKLDVVASLQEARTKAVVEGYLQEAQLIASRTQMRRELAAYNQDGNPSRLSVVNRIIVDAKTSALFVEVISIFDTEGTFILGTKDLSSSASLAKESREGSVVRISEIAKDELNRVTVEVVAPLIFENEIIGFAEIVFNADGLMEITEDYTGLGRTGEFLLASRTATGDALYLTPLRFDSGAALARAVSRERKEIPIISAVEGLEAFFTDSGTVDYRGAKVFASTRFIEGLEWGMVAKIDQEEAFEPVKQLRNVLILSIVIIYVGIIAIWFFVGDRIFVQPLRALTLFAQNISAGNLKLRIELQDKSEIGFLAKTMNKMIGEIEELYRGLEEKVEERTRELKKFQQAVESSTDGVLMIDATFDITYVNPAFVKISGTPQKTLISKNADSYLTSSETPEEVHEAFLNSIKEGKPYVTDSFILAGNNTPVRLAVYPVLKDETQVFYVVLVQDISELKAIDKAKTEFVSLASHQLRTPLSSINWYAEMLLAGDAGELNPEQTQFLKEVYAGNQRMVELVDSLLNVSRLELGTFVIEPKDVDLIALGQSVIKEQKPQIEVRNITLKTKFDDTLPSLYIDEKLIRMVLQNLLSNAVKYTEKGGTVSLSIIQKNDMVDIQVSDTGYGIPQEEQKKIFGKLFRATNVREKDTEGTGLGLYIVKSVVEKSGGTIRFESEEGTGTTFFVTLPLKKGDMTSK